jgi:cysteine sulfinate desulfinase/cysteine desulfurase-like protein
VLTAMGLNIEDIESSIRLSWGNNDNIITNLELLIQTAKKL